jgi:hypothetical protein
MLIALLDYIKYRLQVGRYSARSIEQAHGSLATAENFPPDSFPKPGQIIIVHTRESFISWLVMYFTDSIWSHTAIGVDDGDIVEVTLGGTIAHPFADILNNTDYLIIGRPPMTQDQERGIAEHARSGVGVVKLSYRVAATMGIRTLLGRDDKYRIRLSLDLLTVLLLICWMVRRRKTALISSSIFGILYITTVIVNTKYRRSLRKRREEAASSNDKRSNPPIVPEP